MGLMNECYRSILGRWVDCKVPQPGKEMPVLTPSAHGECKALRVCWACLAAPSACTWGRVAWICSLNRLASCKLSSFLFLWRSCIRLVGNPWKAGSWGNAWDSSVTPPPWEAGEVRCNLMGKVNFIPVPKFFPIRTLSKLGRCCGEWSDFALVSEQQIISSQAVQTASWFFIILTCLFFKYFVACWNKWKL